jgi:hypothetical protein
MSAQRSPEVLDVRPHPLVMTVLVLSCCPFFALPGVFMLFALVPEASTGHVKVSASLGVMGLAFIGVGILIGIFAYRMARTVVRFELGEERVTIAWRRAGRVIRTEELVREDLVDVAIDESPSSGSGPIYRLVVGTKNGDIALTASSSSGRTLYVPKAERLHRFLGIPLRT